VINSKYPGVSHSPRNASSRRTAFLVSCNWNDLAPLFSPPPSSFSLPLAPGESRVRLPICSVSLGDKVCKGVGSLAMPQLSPIEVWTQRRNGELWTMILYLRRFGLVPLFGFLDAAASSCCILSRSMDDILAPRACVCSQPLYVRGGS